MYRAASTTPFTTFQSLLFSFPIDHSTLMAPSTHTAAVINEKAEVEVKKIALPKVGEGEVLVKVVAAALNPTDCTRRLA